MNKKVMCAVAGVVLLGVSYISYRLGCHMTRAECEKKLQEMDNYYKERDIKTKLSRDNLKKPPIEAIVNQNDKFDPSVENLLKSFQGTIENHEYVPYSNLDPSDEDEGVDIITDGPVHPEEGPADTPYPISPEMFANSKPYYDKITLVYYSGDGVLLTEEDEQVFDIHGSIGDGLDHFGDYESDVSYVRNEVLGSDFEIIRENRRYFEE